MSLGFIVVFAVIVLASRVMIFKGHRSSVREMNGEEGRA